MTKGERGAGKWGERERGGWWFEGGGVESEEGLKRKKHPFGVRFKDGGGARNPPDVSGLFCVGLNHGLQVRECKGVGVNPAAVCVPVTFPQHSLQKRRVDGRRCVREDDAGLHRSGSCRARVVLR